jgi:hypothetical protein
MVIKIDEFTFEATFIGGNKLVVPQLKILKKDFTINEIIYFKEWADEAQEGVSPTIYKRDVKYEGNFWAGTLKGCFPRFPHPDEVELNVDYFTEDE